MPIKRIYVMTDLEGVAGVLDHRNWCSPGSTYYDLAKKFLTMEVNAAVAGFLEGGAEEIVVADGHGPGGLNPELLDERVEFQRGWPSDTWPLGLDQSFDACAWVGQHARSRSVGAHLAHTQSFKYYELTVNGIAIGEFGQFGMCASELGVRSIFGSGDRAFTREAQELVPGIETAAVKRGLQSKAGDGLSWEDYSTWNTAAVHLHPARARKAIKIGARRSIDRASKEDFGIIPMKAPYQRVTVFRPHDEVTWQISRESHESSFAGLMNMPYHPVDMDAPPGSEM